MAAKDGQSSIRRSALLVAKRPRCHSSLGVTDRCTAASASGSDEADVSRSRDWRHGPGGVPYPGSGFAIKDGAVAERVDPLRIRQPIALVPEPALAKVEASWPASILSTFVGRADQLAELGTHLRQPDARAVTLTGPGGVGKTRLAVEVARQNGDEFPGGVGFVSLAAVRDATSSSLRSPRPSDPGATMLPRCRSSPTLWVAPESSSCWTTWSRLSKRAQMCRTSSGIARACPCL